MHVDLYLAAACCHTFEHRFPELVASLCDAALSVHAKGNPADLRDRLQQGSDGIPAIRSVSFRSEAFDGVVRDGARDPAIAVHPDAQLEIHSARHRLFAYEP